MLKKLKYNAAAVIAAGSLLFLTACSHSVSEVDSQGKTVSPVFPDPASAVRTEGSFVNLDNLRQVRPEMTKAQLYELIGVPHFKEGVIRVKEWDYIFHFGQADNSVLTCQFKVLFDSSMKAQSFYFSPANCLSMLKTGTMHKELSSEGLFAFGSATLSKAGVAQVSQLAADMKATGLNGKRVVVTGYTDRIGKPAANQRLSQARAESVKRLLVSQGIAGATISTRGLGDSEPRVTCPGSATAEVIACLAPNRRMTVDIVE
ncbi:Outer membrane protein II* [Leminorella richardii]|uniref:Outer membrane protein II n=1 Tax=Leminorella richardii TaxID=158841 RepID=A0A2X4UV79_9GAMM|nr:OmpA family protein [Leminorella richardii]SQI43756.1 Outer membrane protein II* [Leminorella richardii]